MILILLISTSIYFLNKNGGENSKNSTDKYKNYLSKVYPLTDWDNINTEQAVDFYNSLGFIYNPCSQHLETDLTVIDDNPYDKGTDQYGQVVCGGPWESLDICKDYSPPYPPKGYLLSFEDYHKNNQSTIYSNGKGDIERLTSYRQTLHWGESSSKGEISRSCRSGPGPYWVTPFSIVRNYYYPNGINFQDGKWSIKCNMSNKLKNHGCLWNYPKNWTNGFLEGEYIEVTHAQNNPGMAQSVGFWFNGFPGGGTGIFLKIGKTHIANNKIDALYTLLEKLNNSSAEDLKSTMKDTKFVGNSGSEILQYYYNTTDINDITWGYANGEWKAMSYTADGGILVDPSASTWKWIGNKGILNASGLMSPSNISISGPDGNGYKPNMTVNFENVANWWLKQKGISGGLTKENKKLVINAARNPQEDIDYFPNRAGGMVPPDEPNCWLGFVLGIETIQMPMSANDNGLWVYEIIDLRIPTSQNTPGLSEQYNWWSTKCKERIYGWILDGSDPSEPIWNPDGQGFWMDHIQKFLSSRDPFDKSKGANCKDIAYITGLTKEQCKNPFPNIQSVPNLSSQGYYDSLNRCWVSVSNIGWQNLPCKKDTLQEQYIKIPLMYPSIQHISSLSERELNEIQQSSPIYMRNIKEQNPRVARLKLLK